VNISVLLSPRRRDACSASLRKSKVACISCLPYYRGPKGSWCHARCNVQGPRYLPCNSTHVQCPKHVTTHSIGIHANLHLVKMESRPGTFRLLTRWRSSEYQTTSFPHKLAYHVQNLPALLTGFVPVSPFCAVNGPAR
jgi:hypothetical protein